jgi:hypothetical protein
MHKTMAVPLIPRIPEAQARETFSADRRITFSQLRPGIEKATTNPEDPVNPVKNKSLAEKTIEDVLKHYGKTIKKARIKYRQFVEKGISYFSINELDYSGADVAKALNVSRASVSKARSRGEKLINKDQYLWNLLKTS